MSSACNSFMLLSFVKLETKKNHKFLKQCESDFFTHFTNFSVTAATSEHHKFLSYANFILLPTPALFHPYTFARIAGGEWKGRLILAVRRQDEEEKNKIKFMSRHFFAPFSLIHSFASGFIKGAHYNGREEISL